jgi:hypothetical protein
MDGARPFLGTGRVRITGVDAFCWRLLRHVHVQYIVGNGYWLGIDVQYGFDFQRLTVYNTSLIFGAADTARFILAIVEGGSRDMEPSIR